MARYGAAGLFWKAVPQEQWPEDPEYLAAIQAQWVEPFGDMRQELVFIGQGLEKQNIIDRLNACLLSDAELLEGKGAWSRLPDPFPAWDH